MSSIRLNQVMHFLSFMVVLVITSTVYADVADFEDMNLLPESYWNGSDGPGGFVSGDIRFSNIYNSDWDSWEGFSCSNITDNTTSGLDGQYNAITGAGQAGTASYAVCCVGWTEIPTMTLNTPAVVDGLYVTNSNYAYYSMLNGDMFSKKFGGDSGNDPDFFLLTVTGKDSDGVITGTVDFYLADFRSGNNNDDYILDTWEYVDLSSLGTVKTIEVALSSSDTGDWGMNTPAYFALDSIEYQPVSVYTAPYTEAGINGYINPDDRQPASPDDSGAIINPIFKGWATEAVSCYQAPGVDPQWSDTDKALGPVTGRFDDIFSLGDLSVEQIGEGVLPGQITVTFDEPIRNGKGYDFVIFENGILAELSTGNGSVPNQLMAELAYVEVSSNGQDFARFRGVSLTEEAVGKYGTIDMNKVHNLAGKHPNAYGICTGTPFDLEDIKNDPLVTAGVVDINDILFVRIVDIPGTGDFSDNAAECVNPDTWPDWDNYKNTHPIYDAWLTWGSGGFDLEAVGVLHEQQFSADINLDGIVDEADLELIDSAMGSHFGQSSWMARCDLAEPKDMVVDDADLEVLMEQLHGEEQWRY